MIYKLFHSISQFIVVRPLKTKQVANLLSFSLFLLKAEEIKLKSSKRNKIVKEFKYKKEEWEVILSTIIQIRISKN